LAQSERQQETQSLIEILRDLEEKYSAQEKQFAYYRSRLEPLEQSNAQLTALIEHLLDLIDGGFGENSLDPLRKASAMASAMLRSDMEDAGETFPEAAQADPEPEVDPEPETGNGLDEAAPYAAPEMATLDDIDADGEAIHEHGFAAEADGSDPEEEPAVEQEAFQDLVAFGEDDAGDFGDGAAAADPDSDGESMLADDDAVADDPEEETRFGEVADFELEEVALSNLTKDIEDVSDIDGNGFDAVAAAEDEFPDMAALMSDAAAGDGQDETQWAHQDTSVRFEDVSDAVLALELEEDAAAGFDDLPEIVNSAAAEFQSDDAASEAESIAALARAMEEEVKVDNGAPPATSDIRSLMLRVEALAKKAEAMRHAQGDAAGEVASDGKDSGVAA